MTDHSDLRTPRRTASLGKILHIKSHEVGNASILFFYLFFVIGAYMMGQAVGDALFLGVFPTHLPNAMIGSALMIAGLVAVYIRFSNRVHLESLIVGTLAFFAVSFVFFWWMAHLNFRWVYVPVYLWVYAAGAMGPMMGWTLANYVLTTREARRIFGFIGAGAILGGTCFSFFTSDVLRHEHLQPHTLLLAIALLLGSCAVLVKVLFRKAAPRLTAVSQGPAAGHGTPEGFLQSLMMIRGSRYLILVSSLIAVGSLATCILGYQFKLIAKEHFGTDLAGLAAFFGRFNGYMGLAAFVFQLALTGPLLRTFGIRVTLLVVPITLMGTSMGVMVAPTLLMGSILRGSHYLLRYSLDKSSMELLYLPLRREVKSQVKSFIDTFVWRSADGMAGLLLLLFANVFKFSPSQVSALNLFVLLGWIVVAYRVRREYLNVLRQAIQNRTLDPNSAVAPVLDSTTHEVLARTLEQGGEQQLLYGMSLFEMERRTALHPALRRLLDHRSPAVRLSALRLLGNAGDTQIQPRVEELVGDENIEVRAEALHYLAAHAGRDPVSFLTKDSDLPIHLVQGAIAAYFLQDKDVDWTAAVEHLLETMAQSTGTAAVPARREAARLLGLVESPSELHTHLHPLLEDESPLVVREALLSAGRARNSECLPVIIQKLGKPSLVGAARTALVLLGADAVQALELYLNDRAVPMPVRRQIPKALAHIHCKESASALAHSLVQGDPGLRYDVLKALNRLRETKPELLPMDVDYADMLHLELIGHFRSHQILAGMDPLSAGKPEYDAGRSGEGLLRRAFRERMEHELERIFRLLALIYPSRDINNAYVGLTLGDPQRQANSLEMLEHLVHPLLYRRLAALLDREADPKQLLETARSLCHTEIESPAESLRILLRSEDRWLRICTIYAAGRLRLRELRQEISALANEDDPLLAETRDWALTQLAAGANT